MARISSDQKNPRGLPNLHSTIFYKKRPNISSTRKMSRSYMTEPLVFLTLDPQHHILDMQQYMNYEVSFDENLYLPSTMDLQIETVTDRRSSFFKVTIEVYLRLFQTFFV